MPQFNINGPGSPSFILTSEKIETALTYKPAKQEDVEALQTAVAKKAEKTDLDAYTTTQDLEGMLEKKADLTKLDEYTNTETLESKLKDKADKTDLDAYTPTEQLTSLLDAKANADDLDNYVLSEKHEADLKLKADKTDLDNYATTAALNSGLESKADTDDVAKTYATKDELAQAQVGTETTLAGYAKTDWVEEQLLTKASAATVTELTETVSGKAEQSALQELSDTVDGKAEQSALATLTETVNKKADATTVESTYAKKSDIASAVRYKESVQTLADLQDKKETAQLGDLFNVVESDMNYVYNGSDFDAMAPMTDLSGYALKTYVDTETAKKANVSHSHQASEVQFSDGEDFQTKLDNGSLQGPAGPAGSSGTVGPQGPAGPNLVDTTTTTSINGLLKGNGETVAQAADGTDYMSPSKVSEAVNEYAPKYLSVTLSSESWADNAQNVTATGVLADETAQEIHIMPKASNIDAYFQAGIYCSGQSENSLSFKCSKAPAENLTVYIVLQKIQKG